MTVWTEEEIQILKDYAAAGASKARIAVRLKRSVSAIKREAHKHGIKLKSDSDLRKDNGLGSRWTENRST